jgi:TonB family protein
VRWLSLLLLATSFSPSAARADEAQGLRLPRLLRSVEARYPAEEQAAGKSGTVALSIDIDARGRVTNVEVVESAGSHFDAAAVEAVRQFRFEPAALGGKAVAVRLRYRYQFVLPAQSAAPLDSARGERELFAGGGGERPGAYETTVRGTTGAAPAQVEVEASQARLVPGSEGDVLKVLEDLPGTARPSLGSGQLIVWGAKTSETPILVDGVPIPALFHTGGLRSTVNGDLLRSVTLTPGGYGAPYGRGLGGLVRAETAELPPSGTHGYVAADVLDASALVSSAVGERFRIAAAARYSWLDQLLHLSLAEQSYFPVPRWDDYQLKAELRLSDEEKLSFLFLGSDDSVLRALPSADPAQALSDTSYVHSYRGILTYERRQENGDLTTVMPFLGFDRQGQGTDFSGTPTSLRVDALRFGVRASYRSRLDSHWTLSLGMDLDGSSSRVTRLGSLTLPPREGDLYVFGQAPSDDVHRDDFRVVQVGPAPWLQAELRLGPVSLTPGLRVDANAVEGSHVLPPVQGVPQVGFQRVDASVDPRLALNVRAHPRLTLSAAFGLYHQRPDAADLSPVFGNPTLTPAQALQVTAGANAALTPTLSVELVGYYKQLDGLAARNPAPSPPLGEALLQEGTGTDYGAQLFLRQELWRGLFGWVGYTLGHAERLDHPSGQTRLFDFDQTHVLTAVASYQWRQWSFGARLRYATGYPRSPVVGAYYDVRDDRFDPLFGPQNSIRLPSFVQLDLRADRAFRLPQSTLDLYLELLNVTDRRSAEEIVYSESYARRGYITGLPILAVLGARVSF